MESRVNTNSINNTNNGVLCEIYDKLKMHTDRVKLLEVSEIEECIQIIRKDLRNLSRDDKITKNKCAFMLRKIQKSYQDFENYIRSNEISLYYNSNVQMVPSVSQNNNNNNFADALILSNNDFLQNSQQSNITILQNLTLDMDTNSSRLNTDDFVYENNHLNSQLEETEPHFKLPYSIADLPIIFCDEPTSLQKSLVDKPATNESETEIAETFEEIINNLETTCQMALNCTEEIIGCFESLCLEYKDKKAKKTNLNNTSLSEEFIEEYWEEITQDISTFFQDKIRSSNKRTYKNVCATSFNWKKIKID